MDKMKNTGRRGVKKGGEKKHRLFQNPLAGKNNFSLGKTKEAGQGRTSRACASRTEGDRTSGGKGKTRKSRVGEAELEKMEEWGPV